MLFLGSHASEMAIRAALHLAAQPPGKLSPTREIAAGAGLPAAYLAKIMRLLIRSGLVRAFRGPGGGVELGRPAGAISLAALVRAVEGDPVPDKCIMGMGGCSQGAPCVLHAQWMPLREEISKFLDETSLEMLVRAAQEKPPVIPIEMRDAPRREAAPVEAMYRHKTRLRAGKRQVRS